MNTKDSRRTALPALLIAMALTWASGAGAANLSEPPLVVYGKVVKLGQGTAYQLFSGAMQLKLVNTQNPESVLVFDIPLRKVGINGEFSYRVEIDRETEPPADRLATTLVIGSGVINYTIQSVTVDGYPASLLDARQSAGLASALGGRGEEFRLDFKTDVPTPDTDGDGVADWWEQLYGLDPTDGADALADEDGDGWNNLKEFQLGTDPLIANQEPLLQDSLLVVTAGGSAGVYLSIADTDTAPENLALTLLDGGDGLTWKRSATALQTGDRFTYADILAGRISVDVSKSLINDTVRFRLDDQTTDGAEPRELAVMVEAFSPSRGWLANPALWLDAGSLNQNAPVEEWTDASARRHDGYQPYPAARPVADGPGRLAFNASEFLYVDDREDRLGQFTAFMAFELGAETSADQTLFSSQDLEVGLGGPGSGIHGRSLQIIQNGRTINGPVVDPGVPMTLTLHSTVEAAALRIPGQGSIGSRDGEGAPFSSFTTVGARHRFSSSAAENFFHGSLREVLIYDRPLTLRIRGLIEDYQLSRWQRVRLWNYRGATLPVAISGADGVRNAINGGDSNDNLAGADRADILRGGGGDNRLTGNGGADRFLFSKTGGKEVITDFLVNDGDTIDLTEVFGGMSGLPSNYVKIKTVVERDDNNFPRVDTHLELNYDGSGSTVDQTIMLEGVAFGGTDLPRLVGEGNLLLGGPRYQSVIGLAVSAPGPASSDRSLKLTVSRAGNTDAAIQVPLSLGGTARVDADYQIAGSLGTGTVRSLPLARGASQAVFDILPMVDGSAPAMDLSITALPVAQVSDGGASLSTTLHGDSSLPILTIQTVHHIHPQLGLHGLAQISRTGGLDQALDVPFTASGSLVGGAHVQALPARVYFAPGQVTSPVTVTPLAPPPAGNELSSLHISLTADPDRYNLGSPATATVLWVPEGGEEAALDYAGWRNRYFPVNSSSGLDHLDSDRDGKSNILEYLAGSDPTLADHERLDFSIVPVESGYEVRWASVRALTDVRVDLQESTGLVNWMQSPIIDTEDLITLPDGRIQHAYRFDADPANRFFRISPVTP